MLSPAVYSASIILILVCPFIDPNGIVNEIGTVVAGTHAIFANAPFEYTFSPASKKSPS